MSSKIKMSTAIFAATAVLALGWAPHAAFGQAAALDDDDDLDEPTAQEVPSTTPSSKYGAGIRLRQVFIPDAILDLIWQSPGGGSHTGFGGEFIWQKGDRAVVVGVEYESLEATNNQLWVERGEEPIDGVDLVQFKDFRWLTLDVSLIWNADLHRMFSIRYGVGIGVGLLLGDILRTDYSCPDNTLETCTETDGGVTENGVPPVAPVLNMILGVQFRPIENIAINLEGGIRTVPFVGTSVGYLF